jgi:hypothetical protein
MNAGKNAYLRLVCHFYTLAPSLYPSLPRSYILTAILNSLSMTYVNLRPLLDRTFLTTYDTQNDIVQNEKALYDNPE